MSKPAIHGDCGSIYVAYPLFLRRNTPNLLKKLCKDSTKTREFKIYFVFFVTFAQK